MRKIVKNYRLISIFISRHPDKSDHPEAEAKFIEIKQAYELLSDSERRKAFDMHGITNEDYYRQRPDYSNYGRFAPDPFEEFFGHRGHFHEQDISLFHKLSITTKYYEANVVPKSKTTPHIIMFYSDWCFACMRAAPAFKKMIDSLEGLGVVFATVNAGHENQLTRKAGVASLPSIVMVLDEHNYVYKESVFSVQKVVEFVRHKLPYKLILPVNDGSMDKFLNGWHDNRVRALIFEPRLQPRLRYLLTAFYFKNRVHFGFVQNLSPESKALLERYKVNPTLDTLMLFNEDSARPVASASMTDISSQTLSNIIGSNQYLALPRLSSQGMLDGICPAEWNRPKKRLCVILITENSGNHDYARQVLRRIAIESTYNPERVKFAYIYKDKQQDFIHALSVKSGPNDALLKVVVIWRRDTKHVKYEWIPDAKLEETTNIGEDEDNFNKTKQKIDETIQKLLKSTFEMTFEAEVKVSFTVAFSLVQFANHTQAAFKLRRLNGLGV